MASLADEIENEIRLKSQTKRIRPSQFFIDYDRLRSGYVTASQFFRVLWENLEVKLNPEQEQALADRYTLQQQPGRMNYKVFCTAVDQPFDPNMLRTNPQYQKIGAQELLGTTRSLRPLSPATENRIEKMLTNIARFYKYRGINLRTCCEDFDRHHVGVIQESQFYRSIPVPPEITEQDITLLVKKYRDPDKPGLFNYLNLHHDITALTDNIAEEAKIALPKPTSLTDYLPPPAGADSTLQNIFDKIRVTVFKHRVRTIEYFKDYDKLRSGCITANQFICGLSLAIGKEAQLSRSEMQKVVEYYRQPDGRVLYKEFCDMMENAFNIPDLDKKPTQSVIRPADGALGRNLPFLSEAEECRLQQVLAELAEQVQKRRLMMYQYFKDFDRSTAYSRVITPNQFGRILHFLSLNVAPEDLKLLCRKFVDQPTNDINYPAFVQCVDKEFVNYTQEREIVENMRLITNTPPQPIDTSGVDFSMLMARIRDHALTLRRRVCEFFADYDPLRSGFITKSQFRRCLSDFGLSLIGKHVLTDAQFEVLCNYYRSPNDPQKINWTRFENDVESVFTQKSLEKTPSHQVPHQQYFLTPKPGTMNWDFATDEQREFFNQVMDRLRQRTNQRRVLTKPTFQDFDKNNNGHITRGQFRQALNVLELHASEPEMQALEAKFCNDTGFNYKAFLQELQPAEIIKPMYVGRLEDLRSANENGRLPERDPARDLEGVLLKIRTKVCRERMRIYEWMRDYDKLNHGRMIKGNFRRALDLCKFELNESELAILEDHYQSGEEDYIEYVKFCEDVESIFTTNNLEKAPMLEVEQFRPDEEWTRNKVDQQMDEMTQECLCRISDKVRKTRMQLFPLFEDFDKVHNGTLSKMQFRRVLMELELANLVGTEREWQNLWKRFEVKVGGRMDTNYVAFCDTIYNLCGFEYRKP